MSKMTKINWSTILKVIVAVEPSLAHSVCRAWWDERR